ncbi:PREDICTED: putative pumilio homolog 8, chloroplastic [Tarenaya hassleriana]|uniref:putative pumilio homolog 8, chloroplastic n=1 Tax=Tarenaya hassleriana TaxID=28532 RepID=UPI00053C41C6|nr:PREDICTED: putative pumilio homolog 8, chloroplastic [Tarenaya hassleriana]XP_010521191.1 PREDICTED: putative pumilio homolog 8, chloroplastic [Tarenaya hassleriana]
MMMKNEFSSASSPSRSPPLMEILRTSSHSSNLHFFPQNFCGESSSSSVSFRSSSDHSISFSNGLCSSDGSPFAPPLFDPTAKYCHASPVSLFHKDVKSINEEDLGLWENLYLMNIRDDDEDDEEEGEKGSNGRTENRTDVLGSIPENDHAEFTGIPFYSLGKCEKLNGFNNGGFGPGGFPYGVSSAYGVDKSALFYNQKGSTGIDHKISYDPWLNAGRYNRSSSGSDQRNSVKRNIFGMSAVPLQRPYSSPYRADLFANSQQLGMFRCASNSCPSRQMAKPGFSYNVSCRGTDLSPLFCQDTVGFPTNRVPQSMVSAKGVERFSFEDSLLLQGKSLNYGVDSYKIPPLDHRRRGIGNTDTRPCLLNVSEIQGYVYLMAKDQHGCRFLQWVFAEGSAIDATAIFNEVIDHVVELMMDPFGNYLMQKLLDVCTEEQRTEIILVATAEPGQLIRISLNAYGTRVVQRLVETIRTRKQISLVKAALRPGFLDLIKDLNGNHVIQRCLQCLSAEDCKFIFDAATKFSADIATHRHGCCVLQKCIAHSMGQQREKLVAEISRNSLLLAQDPFGNYAVQYVIDLRSPSAMAMMLAQFKGHYVQLSMQKFSSHVVERCLTYYPETRPQIVRELVSVLHFDQLLQDPFANFVIQSALSVTKGPLYASLVEVIMPHSILRNNPYCKRIFSRNLLNK